MKRVQTVMLTGAGLLALSNPAWAQEPGPPNAQAGESTAELDEIIVTARRRLERLQDVPSTVDVVTAEEINKLNIRQFEDIQTVVPGLTFESSTGSLSASVRGISFNQFASGSNGTIEFYLNDSPLPAQNLFEVMYDVGQIELLRGPQGTLRGRASPSGSMTVTTRRPDLVEMGGHVNMTGTDDSGLNFNGAINVPLVSDKLAIRVAALVDDNAGTAIESVNNSQDANERTKSARATLAFEPTDNLSFLASYQQLDRKARSFVQVESLQVLDPSAPASPAFITGNDRRAAQDTPTNVHFNLDIVNWQAQWAFAGQQVSYVGSTNKSTNTLQDVSDTGDFFGPSAPAFLTGFGQFTDTHAKTRAHELRLASEERLFGLFDYILGGFYYKVESPTNVLQASPVVIPPPIPGNPGLIASTPIQRNNETREQSFFGNLTWHLGEKTEISGGLRRIDYEANAGLMINGVPLAAAAQSDDFNTTIYSGSIKYRFNDDLMTYATVGTAWRPGITVIGDFSLAPSPLERSFLILPPEESTSYELGLKASAFERRMQVNLALFHQKFDNYPWRAPSSVFFVETAANTATTPPTLFQRITPFNFVGAVPVEVNGVEVESSFAATEHWDVSANASYAKSKIEDGVVPCNDYFPRDGIPDSGSTVPTVAQIVAATGGGTVSGCQVDYRASLSPLWSAALQSEYRVPFSTRLEGYVRGLASLYGDSQNDPTNSVDDVKNYSVLNLYLGLRGGSGAWEVSLYGKNLTDTERVLSRSSTPLTTSFRQLATPVTGTTTYRRISFIAPREFGLSLRYSFGGR